MPKRSYKQVLIDPGLRERALQVIESYEKRSTVPASDLAADRLSALLPVAMTAIGDALQAYDRGELPLAAQKQLITTLKKIASKFEGPS